MQRARPDVDRTIRCSMGQGFAKNIRKELGNADPIAVNRFFEGEIGFNGPVRDRPPSPTPRSLLSSGVAPVAALQAARRMAESSTFRLVRETIATAGHRGPTQTICPAVSSRWSPQIGAFVTLHGRRIWNEIHSVKPIRGRATLPHTKYPQHCPSQGLKACCAHNVFHRVTNRLGSTMTGA